MKRGGQVIYAGALGSNSQLLVEYFEVSFISIFSLDCFKDVHGFSTVCIYALFCLFLVYFWSARNQRGLQSCYMDARS